MSFTYVKLNRKLMILSPGIVARPVSVFNRVKAERASLFGGLHHGEQQTFLITHLRFP